MGFPMSSFTLRPLATILLTATATLALAADQAAPPAAAPGAAPQQKLAPLPVDAPPAKPYTIPPKAKDFIKAAIEAPDRTPGMTVHDAYRKPAELLALAGVKPGQRVIEFSAYGNYWSSLLSSVVGPKGELHMVDATFADQYIPWHEEFMKTHTNTKFQSIDFGKYEPPKGVDVVWCVGCFHEILATGTDLAAFHAKLFKAMKPGAIYMVVFYTAKDGRETNDLGKTHRIDPATVRAHIQAGGFALHTEDRMFKNPQDNLTTQVFTESEGDLADRTVYKFRKP